MLEEDKIDTLTLMRKILHYGKMPSIGCCETFKNSILQWRHGFRTFSEVSLQPFIYLLLKIFKHHRHQNLAVKVGFS